MKYKKKQLYDSLNNCDKKNEEFLENFKNAKKNKKNNKVKYKIKNRKKFFLKLILIIFSIIGLVLIVLFCFYKNFFSKNFNKDEDFNRSYDVLGIDYKIDKKVTNIAFFGLDKRDEDKRGRSDSIIIVSFDGIHGKIKAISILRDTRLLIKGYGKDKLGHAYSYGGPSLAVQTLNKNFNLDIRDYVSFNFNQMVKIIDILGGVDAKISKGQVNEINGVINSTSEYKNSGFLAPFKEKEKVVHLNGAQAVSYARIRKKDDEHSRANRQQIIVNLMLEKLKKIKINEYPKILKKLKPYFKTSLSFKEILKFAPFILKGKPQIERKIIPYRNDPNLKSGLVNGIWYWQYDIEQYKKKIHDFIYEK